MTVSQSYVGKAVDFCVFETSATAGYELVNVGITGSGSVVAGPYKIVQKATKFMLTEKGSVPSDPEYGTVFVAKLFGGQIQTSMALLFYFSGERQDIINYINSSVLVPPADEQLTDMQLEDFSVTLDKATMRIKFYFADSSVILAPVAISTV